MITGLLDTSAYSAFMRGHEELRLALQRTDRIVLTPVVLGELGAGFRAGARLKKNTGELRRFLASPRVRREADLFWRDLVGRARSGESAPAMMGREKADLFLDGLRGGHSLEAASTVALQSYPTFDLSISFARLLGLEAFAALQ